jgi:hypothetical protein
MFTNNTLDTGESKLNKFKPTQPLTRALDLLIQEHRSPSESLELRHLLDRTVPVPNKGPVKIGQLTPDDLHLLQVQHLGEAQQLNAEADIHEAFARFLGAVGASTFSEWSKAFDQDLGRMADAAKDAGVTFGDFFTVLDHTISDADAVRPLRVTLSPAGAGLRWMRMTSDD